MSAVTSKPKTAADIKAEQLRRYRMAAKEAMEPAGLRAPVDPPGGSAAKLVTMQGLNPHKAKLTTRDRVSAAIALVRARQAARRIPAEDVLTPKSAARGAAGPGPAGPRPGAGAEPIFKTTAGYSPRNAPKAPTGRSANTSMSMSMSMSMSASTDNNNNTQAPGRSPSPVNSQGRRSTGRSPARKAFAVDALKHQSPYQRAPLTPKTQEQEQVSSLPQKNFKPQESPKQTSPGSGSFFTNIFASRPSGTKITNPVHSLPSMSCTGDEIGNQENAPQEAVSPIALSSPRSAVRSPARRPVAHHVEPTNSDASSGDYAVSHHVNSDDTDECSVDPETLTDVGHFIDALHNKQKLQPVVNTATPNQGTCDQQILHIASSDSIDDSNILIGAETLAGIGHYIDAMAKPRERHFLAATTSSSDGEDLLPLETKVGIEAFIDSLHNKPRSPKKNKQTLYVSSSEDSSLDQPAHEQSKQIGDQSCPVEGGETEIDNFYEQRSVDSEDEDQLILDDVLRDSDSDDADSLQNEQVVKETEKGASSLASGITLNPSDLAGEDFLEADLAKIMEETPPTSMVQLSPASDEGAVMLDDLTTAVRSGDVAIPCVEASAEHSEHECSHMGNTEHHTKPDDIPLDAVQTEVSNDGPLDTLQATVSDDGLSDAVQVTMSDNIPCDAVQATVADIDPITAVRSDIIGSDRSVEDEDFDVSAGAKRLQEIIQRVGERERANAQVPLEVDSSIENAQLEKALAEDIEAAWEVQEGEESAHDLLAAFHAGLSTSSEDEKDLNLTDAPDSPQSQGPLFKVFSAMESLDEDENIKSFLMKMGAVVGEDDFFSKITPPIGASEDEIRKLNEMVQNVSKLAVVHDAQFDQDEGEIPSSSSTTETTDVADNNAVISSSKSDIDHKSAAVNSLGEGGKLALVETTDAAKSTFVEAWDTDLLSPTNMKSDSSTVVGGVGQDTISAVDERGISPTDACLVDTSTPRTDNTGDAGARAYAGRIKYDFECSEREEMFVAPPSEDVELTFEDTAEAIKRTCKDTAYDNQDGEEVAVTESGRDEEFSSQRLGNGEGSVKEETSIAESDTAVEVFTPVNDIPVMEPRAAEQYLNVEELSLGSVCENKVDTVEFNCEDEAPTSEVARDDVMPVDDHSIQNDAREFACDQDELAAERNLDSEEHTSEVIDDEVPTHEFDLDVDGSTLELDDGLIRELAFDDGVVTLKAVSDGEGSAHEISFDDGGSIHETAPDNEVHTHELPGTREGAPQEVPFEGEGSNHEVPFSEEGSILEIASDDEGKPLETGFDDEESTHEMTHDDDGSTHEMALDIEGSTHQTAVNNQEPAYKLPIDDEEDVCELSRNGEEPTCESSHDDDEPTHNLAPHNAKPSHNYTLSDEDQAVELTLDDEEDPVNESALDDVEESVHESGFDDEEEPDCESTVGLTLVEVDEPAHESSLDDESPALKTFDGTNFTRDVSSVDCGESSCVDSAEVCETIQSTADGIGKEESHEDEDRTLNEMPTDENSAIAEFYDDNESILDDLVEAENLTHVASIDRDDVTRSKTWENSNPSLSEIVDDELATLAECAVDDDTPALANINNYGEPSFSQTLDEMEIESDVHSFFGTRTDSSNGSRSRSDFEQARSGSSNVSECDSFAAATTNTNVSTAGSVEFTVDDFVEAFAPNMVAVSFGQSQDNDFNEDCAGELVDDSVDLVGAFLKRPGSYVEEETATEDFQSLMPNSVRPDPENEGIDNGSLRDLIVTLSEGDAEIFFKLSWGAPKAELKKWKDFIKAVIPFLTGKTAPLVAEAQIRSVASRLEFPRTDDVELIIEQLLCLKADASGITEAPSTDTMDLTKKLNDEKFDQIDEVDEGENISAFLSRMNALKDGGHFSPAVEEEPLTEELAVEVDIDHGFINRQLEAVLSDDDQWWHEDEKVEKSVIDVTSPKGRHRVLNEDDSGSRHARRKRSESPRLRASSPASLRSHMNSRMAKSRSKDFTPARELKSPHHLQIVRASRSYVHSPISGADIKPSLSLTQLPKSMIGDLENMFEERERRMIISNKARNSKWQNPWDKRFEEGGNKGVPLMPRMAKKLPRLSGVEAAKSLSRWSYRPTQRYKMPLKQHWRCAYKERTRNHFGYFDVDVYSVYETSVVIAKAHRFDEEPWEQRDVKQRFLHEKSISLSRNWFGSLLRKRGNDRYREPVAHPKSMEMPMENLPSEGEWVDEWYITWQQRQQGLTKQIERPSDSDSESDDSDDDSDGSETYTYADETTMRDDETSAYSTAYSESAASQSIYTSQRSVYSRRDRNRSNHSLSQFDEEDDDYWEDPPECGTFHNVKQKIGERLSLVHHRHLSSLRQSRWRRKYFPRGTFPYNR